METKNFSTYLDNLIFFSPNVKEGRTMQNLTIITCFSYIGNRKYVFNPQYLRSDLRKIILFSHNRIGCSLENIYVLSDLTPNPELQDEILKDFKEEVEEYFNEIGFRSSIPDIREKPLVWLSKICEYTSRALNRNKSDLYKEITNAILPIIRSSNVVEFVSLFTNFIPICGKVHFNKVLHDLFSIPMSHLFFYYTGHGIRYWTDSTNHEIQDGNSKNYDICLVIPSQKGLVEFYSKRDLQRQFTTIFLNVPSFIVFDCCHAESLLECPFRITFPHSGIGKFVQTSIPANAEIIFLASTRNHQTCGFYTKNGECGSVFTYFLIRFLENIASEIQTSNLFENSQRYRDISRLHSGVEEKVQEYRSTNGKPPQNILMGLSHATITELPLWLFNNLKKGSSCLWLIEENN